MPRVHADGPVTVTSRFNRAFAVVVWVFAAAGTVTAIAVSGIGGLAALLPAAFAALAGWLVLWRPRLDVADEGIVVVNIARTIQIPWEALIHLDTRFALTLFTPHRKIEVFAAPAPGRTATVVARRHERRRGADLPPRPGDLLATESGEAAAVVRDRWEHLRDTGLIETGLADDTPLGVRWHVGSLAAAAVLLVASFGALALESLH